MRLCFPIYDFIKNGKTILVSDFDEQEKWSRKTIGYELEAPNFSKRYQFDNKMSVLYYIL